jgi:hypothetical protein
MILMAVAVFGFALLRLAYTLVNGKRVKLTAGWTEEQLEEETNSTERIGDHKKTFLYGY